jgi:drug/metabolite transporter (DMT)-like permease
LALHGGLRADLRGRWRAVVPLALLDMTVPFLLIAAGERAVSSSLAGILVASVPLLLAALAWRFAPAERVRGIRLAGLVIGFIGVVLLVGVQIGQSPRQLLGATLILAASASYAAATLYLRRAFPDTPPLSVVTGSLLIAAAAVTPVALAQAVDGRLPSAASLPSLLALGVLCSGVAFHLYYVLVSEVGAARASLNTYLSPALAVAFGVIILDEPLTGSLAAGLLLILAGSWLTAGGTPPHWLLVDIARPTRGRRNLDHRATPAVRRARQTSASGDAAPSRGAANWPRSQVAADPIRHQAA